jgi:hypothetical protein
MEETPMPTMTETTLSVEPLKAEYGRAKQRLLTVLAATPDEKINWSPSDSARTPLAVAAHCGLSIKGMQGWLAGEPFPFESMKALDDFSRNEEKKYTTRESAINLIEENSTKFEAFLDGLSQEKLASTFETQMGNFPMMAALTFPADHLRAHTCQIEYIQTIYGDREMYF